MLNTQQQVWCSLVSIPPHFMVRVALLQTALIYFAITQCFFYHYSIFKSYWFNWFYFWYFFANSPYYCTTTGLRKKLRLLLLSKQTVQNPKDSSTVIGDSFSFSQLINSSINRCSSSTHSLLSFASQGLSSTRRCSI